MVQDESVCRFLTFENGRYLELGLNANYRLRHARQTLQPFLAVARCGWPSNHNEVGLIEQLLIRPGSDRTRLG